MFLVTHLTHECGGRGMPTARGKKPGSMNMETGVTYSHAESHKVRCANNPRDNELPSTTKVAEGSGIRTSDVFRVTDA